MCLGGDWYSGSLLDFNQAQPLMGDLAAHMATRATTGGGRLPKEGF